jgi:hypothetical protein
MSCNKIALLCRSWRPGNRDYKEGALSLHLQSQCVRNSASYLHHTSVLVFFSSDPGDANNMFLWNAEWFSTDYRELYHRRQNYSGFLLILWHICSNPQVWSQEKSPILRTSTVATSDLVLSIRFASLSHGKVMHATTEKLLETVKNCVFWDVTLCGSCKNRTFGGT